MLKNRDEHGVKTFDSLRSIYKDSSGNLGDWILERLCTHLRAGEACEVWGQVIFDPFSCPWQGRSSDHQDKQNHVGKEGCEPHHLAGRDWENIRHLKGRYRDLRLGACSNSNLDLDLRQVWSNQYSYVRYRERVGVGKGGEGGGGRVSVQAMSQQALRECCILLT